MEWNLVVIGIILIKTAIPLLLNGLDIGPSHVGLMSPLQACISKFKFNYIIISLNRFV